MHGSGGLCRLPRLPRTIASLGPPIRPRFPSNCVSPAQRCGPQRRRARHNRAAQRVLICTCSWTDAAALRPSREGLDVPATCPNELVHVFSRTNKIKKENEGMSKILACFSIKI